MIVFYVIIGLFLFAVIVGIVVSIIRRNNLNDYDDYEHYLYSENDQISYNEYKGQNAERRVAGILRKIISKIDDAYLVNNVILPSGRDKDGKQRTQEYDHIFLTRKGIFVIETKSIAGTIYGGEFDEQWVHYLGANDEKVYWFYSPIKQNETQVRVLHRFLRNNDVRIYSCVVFDDGDISNVECDRAIVTNQLPAFISSRLKESNDELDSDEVKMLFDKIAYYKDHPIKTRKEHIEEVHQYH